MSGTEQTSRLVRAADVSGLPVVTIEGGEDVAEIRDVVYDGASHLLIGFTLNKRGWFRGTLKRRLEAADVHAIGPDAVMVQSEDALTEAGQADPALEGETETYDVLGNRVLAADGTDLGELSGVILSTSTHPRAVGYEVKTADGSVFVPISAELALSGDNLLLPAAANAFIKDDLTGFGAAVAEFRADLTSEGTQQ